MAKPAKMRKGIEMDRNQKPRYKRDQNEIYGLKRLFYRYKKIIIIGGAAMAALFTAATIGIGYLAYQAVNVSTDQIGVAKQTVTKLLESETLETMAPPEMGVIGGVVASVVGNWLVQSSELGQVQAGLSCLDALGAPSPKDIVRLVKNNLSGSEWITKIETIEAQINGSNGPQGAAACTHWLING